MTTQVLIKAGLFVALIAGGWYLFAPQPSTAPAPGNDAASSPRSDEVATTTTSAEGTEAAVQVTSSTTEVSGDLVLTGTFLGLIESEPDPDRRTFYYLLLNDGTEVMRIDLRSLIGWSDLRIEEKLGVRRGDVIKVTGTLSDDQTKFIPSAITYNNETLTGE